MLNCTTGFDSVRSGINHFNYFSQVFVTSINIGYDGPILSKPLQIPTCKCWLHFCAETVTRQLNPTLEIEHKDLIGIVLNLIYET